MTTCPSPGVTLVMTGLVGTGVTAVEGSLAAPVSPPEFVAVTVNV